MTNHKSFDAQSPSMVLYANEMTNLRNTIEQQKQVIAEHNAVRVAQAEKLRQIYELVAQPWQAPSVDIASGEVARTVDAFSTILDILPAAAVAIEFCAQYYVEGGAAHDEWQMNREKIRSIFRELCKAYPAYAPIPSHVTRSAYDGAREDKLTWKNRALELEHKLQNQAQRPALQLAGALDWLMCILPPEHQTRCIDIHRNSHGVAFNECRQQVIDNARQDIKERNAQVVNSRVAALEGVDGWEWLPHDLRTHLGDFITCVQLVARGTKEPNSRAYWEKQVKTLHKVFQALNMPIPQGDTPDVALTDSQG